MNTPTVRESARTAAEGPHDGASPLLVVGNKRSGTSLLVRVVNAHAQVFIAHEIDIFSVLRQLDRGESFHDDYDWDAPFCLDATVRTLRPTLPDGVDRRMAIRSLFFTVLREVMAHGLQPLQPPVPEKAGRPLRWMGDKKPVQYADPTMRPFLRANFHDARMLHVVRHPRSAVASMKAAGELWSARGAPAFWRESTATVLDRWTTHEEWVIHAKEEGWPVHSVRYEDLCRDPQCAIDGICDFLSIARIDASICGPVSRTTEEKYRSFVIEPDARAIRIMERYGYALDRKP